MQNLRMILTDKFIWLLTAALLLAVTVPVHGAGVRIGQTITSGGIFLIFLLHGIRLERSEVIDGIKNVRLQGAIFGFVFGAMLLMGLLMSKLTDNFLPLDLALGFLFLGVLPSTVQSATSYCAIANGNVAGSVVASALSNLSGVIVAPVLFAVLASAAGMTITSDALVRIATILLLPFVLGQLVQPWARSWVMAHKALTGWTDKIVIAIVVYISFSGATVAGTWLQIEGQQLTILGLGIALMLLFGFYGAWSLGGWLDLNRDDRKTLLFSGAQKSIAIGAPFAAILFPPERAGMILLPLLIYHMAQLIISAPVALHLSKD